MEITRVFPSKDAAWHSVDSIEGTIRKRVLHIATLFKASDRKLYEAFKEGEGVKRLLESEAFLADDLSVTVRLEYTEEEMEVEAIFNNDPTGSTFVVDSKVEDKWQRSVANEICKVFDFVDLSDRVRLILAAPDEEAIADDFEDWSIPSLGSAEELSLLGESSGTYKVSDGDLIKPSAPLNPKLKSKKGDNSQVVDMKSVSHQESNSRRGQETGGSENIGAGGVTPPVEPGGKSTRKSGSLRSDNQKEFVTYINVKNQKNIPKESEKERVHREKVDNAAISFVMDELKKSEKSGWKAKKMDVEGRKNEGYDIMYWNPETEEVRYIEVKGKSGPWVKGVAMTDVQFFFSKKHGDKSLLYVVENALDVPKLFKIRNPAQKATRFVFDKGWKSFSEDGVSQVKQEKGTDVLRSLMNKKDRG